VERAYREALKLGRKYGALKRLGLHKTPEGRAAWRELRLRRSSFISHQTYKCIGDLGVPRPAEAVNPLATGAALLRWGAPRGSVMSQAAGHPAAWGTLHRYLKDFCNRLASELVEAARAAGARIVVDYFQDEARRELLEERLPRGLVKIYMQYIPRFVRLLEGQAKWYGIPVEFKRLHSAKCPECGNILEKGEGRLMKCSSCGFKADRDIVPHYWALKRTKA